MWFRTDLSEHFNVLDDSASEESYDVAKHFFPLA